MDLWPGPGSGRCRDNQESDHLITLFVPQSRAAPRCAPLTSRQKLRKQFGLCDGWVGWAGAGWGRRGPPAGWNVRLWGGATPRSSAQPGDHGDNADTGHVWGRGRVPRVAITHPSDHEAVVGAGPRPLVHGGRAEGGGRGRGWVTLCRGQTVRERGAAVAGVRGLPRGRQLRRGAGQLRGEQLGGPQLLLLEVV